MSHGGSTVLWYVCVCVCVCVCCCYEVWLTGCTGSVVWMNRLRDELKIKKSKSSRK